jgi:predicted amidohydrolase YtcJ
MAGHVRGDAGVDTLIVDGLFGPEHGERWMPCGSAVATGMRISLHNDPPVTPEEPLRNISVAATRIAPSGRALGPAYQLFSDVVIGSLEVGKYADMVVLSADPRAVPPEQIADLEVQRTYLAGLQVYPK